MKTVIFTTALLALALCSAPSKHYKLAEFLGGLDFGLGHT